MFFQSKNISLLSIILSHNCANIIDNKAVSGRCHINNTFYIQSASKQSKHSVFITFLKRFTRKRINSFVLTSAIPQGNFAVDFIKNSRSHNNQKHICQYDA